MMHVGAEFLSSCKSVKPNMKLYASKTQWWDRHRIGIPTAEDRNWKEKEGSDMESIRGKVVDI